MPKVEVAIQPEILRWVKRVILEQCPVTRKAQDQIGLLDAWMKKEQVPTLAKVEQLSKDTRIPFGYFFLQHPPEKETTIADYRTLKSKGVAEPSRELIDVVNHMLLVQDWMAEHRQENGFAPLPFVGSASENMHISEIAPSIRMELDLSLEWYRDARSSREAAFRFLREKAMHANILVMQSGVVGPGSNRPLDVKEFRAFTLVHPFAPLVFINACDSAGGKLFSLAHELAHIWLGEDSLLNTGSEHIFVDPVETRCNAVAAEILLPMSIFPSKWEAAFADAGGDVNQTSEILSTYFRCGKIPVLRRALDTKFISRMTYQVMVQAILAQYREQKKKEKKKVGGEYYTMKLSRWDTHFLQALDASTKSGRTSYVDAYRLTGMNGKTFSKLMDKVRGMLV
ncbi:MAG: ImmA/IrrE family metallo-endopeptidase [Selenomonas sp.]|uniref:ImmA/IrrE family metallo-endopeptidase n=1 Tax=Selenomonas sp. TaxID=2053611 RepID=UPI0025EDCD77|nr:ImmA/IrrE family metallo-endopeptidase [Selenomonas sp.]MCI6086330.1 ImmA/IrrE family metallo-endopeptidase [Selenomonas sp.]